MDTELTKHWQAMDDRNCGEVKSRHTYRSISNAADMHRKIGDHYGRDAQKVSHLTLFVLDGQIANL
jgi:hypothetical protein